MTEKEEDKLVPRTVCILLIATCNLHISLGTFCALDAPNHVSFLQGGVLLLSSEHSEGLLSRFGPVAEKENHHLIPIEFGTLNQLRNLVHLVSTGEVRTQL